MQPSLKDIASTVILNSNQTFLTLIIYSSLMNKVVALKEIRLQAEEGTPFTAIREGNLMRQFLIRLFENIE